MNKIGDKIPNAMLEYRKMYPIFDEGLNFWSFPSVNKQVTKALIERSVPIEEEERPNQKIVIVNIISSLAPWTISSYG